jgi:uncharacterized protein YcbK (DUF882 family)
MSRLSAHFDSEEFRCHDGAEAHPDPALIERLERLRGLVGRPCKIVSGYRSPSWNRHVGGAPRSQHLYNRAADLERGYATVTQARQAGFTGIGYCGEWAVHVDVRPTTRPVIFEDC